MNANNLAGNKLLPEALVNPKVLVVNELLGLKKTLNDTNASAGRIGNHIVYLKYFCSCCFYIEEDMLQCQNKSDYKSHLSNHNMLLKGMKKFLDNIDYNDNSSQILKQASFQIITDIQNHISNFDNMAFGN